MNAKLKLCSKEGLLTHCLVEVEVNLQTANKASLASCYVGELGVDLFQPHAKDLPPERRQDPAKRPSQAPILGSRLGSNFCAGPGRAGHLHGEDGHARLCQHSQEGAASFRKSSLRARELDFYAGQWFVQ